MAQTWTSHWPSNWFSLDLNDWFQGCFMPNFRFLVSILTVIFNFVTQSGSDSATQRLRDSVTYPRCRAVHLARGQGHS